MILICSINHNLFDFKQTVYFTDALKILYNYVNNRELYI